MMERWLLTGQEPAGYRQKVEAERLDMISALEKGEIKYQMIGRTSVTGDQDEQYFFDIAPSVTVVESTHRAATMIGYALAPVVVALNPAFRIQGGEPHQKFTVCQYKTGYVDLKGALAELQAMEPGWGGSPTIIGSPQGASSALTTDQVVGVVKKHFKQ